VQLIEKEPFFRDNGIRYFITGPLLKADNTDYNPAVTLPCKGQVTRVYKGMKIPGLRSMNDEFLAKQQLDAQPGEKGEGTFSPRRMKERCGMPCKSVPAPAIQLLTLVQQATPRPLSLAHWVN